VMAGQPDETIHASRLVALAGERPRGNCATTVTECAAPHPSETTTHVRSSSVLALEIGRYVDDLDLGPRAQQAYGWVS
jgi:hypothetical protein